MSKLSYVRNHQRLHNAIHRFLFATKTLIILFLVKIQNCRKTMTNPHDKIVRHRDKIANLRHTVTSPAPHPPEHWIRPANGTGPFRYRSCYERATFSALCLPQPCHSQESLLLISLRSSFLWLSEQSNEEKNN